MWQRIGTFSSAKAIWLALRSKTNDLGALQRIISMLRDIVDGKECGVATPSPVSTIRVFCR